MRHCRTFERRLVSSLPYQIRHGIETTLQSITASRVMLSTFQAALECGLRCMPTPVNSTVIAFGSYGRLDGNTAVSDFDFLIAYEGMRNDAAVNGLRSLIRTVVSSNQCLQFDHRREIEDGVFEFDNSPAYPILSEAELSSDEASSRVVQILSEGRVVYGDQFGTRLRHTQLQSWGFSDNAMLLNMTKLRHALNGFRDSYCKGVMCRNLGDRWKLSNRKVLKAFSLREFSYLATMFAVAETAISVATGTCSEDTAVQLVSSPSVLKIASFSSPRGALANILEDIGVPLRNEIAQRLKTHIEAVPLEDRVAGSDGQLDPGEGKIFGYLRELTLPVIVKYDALLSLLHDVEFIKQIDTLQPDVTTWLGHRSFQRILTYRCEMVKAAIRLAAALNDLLDVIERGAHPIIADAKGALSDIRSYSLREPGAL